ncbi:MAG: phospholipase [Chitinophaga sp.]|jgi:predicted peptidase|nr:phospholipase [Chitinophaga sp.]
MKILKVIIVFISITTFCCFENTIYAQANLFSYNKYKNQSGDSLLYRFLFPDANRSRKYPLVIFLHGSGERGNDNEAQLKWGVTNFATDYNLKMHPAFVIAPQCPANQSWGNSNFPDLTLKPTPTKQFELLVELIKETVQKFPIDTNRIYITGLSMGGIGTFDIIARYPHLFAAALPVCGAGDTSYAAKTAHIPMWIVTGAEDPSVNPNLTLKMLQALVNAGAKPGYTQYPEVGHFSWIAAYSDPLIIEWLFRQHK